MKTELLKVENLKIDFQLEDGCFNAVDGVSFSIFKDELVGLIGESGCGKSVTALSILRLLPQPTAKISSGKIFFKNMDILQLPVKNMRRIRGKEISMIFQEPMTSLSPLHRIHKQLTEGFKIHNSGLSKKEMLDISEYWLAKVGIQDARNKMYSYPSELSGGMRQRVMIAMALIMNPELLIADEPTTALDVTIQAQILDIILQMREELGITLLLITHDLSIVAQVCEKAIVMYAGKIVEISTVNELFVNPLHPYTTGLLKSIPSLEKRSKKMYSISGAPPTLEEKKKLSGCVFSNRCECKLKKCDSEQPPLLEISKGRLCACFLHI